MVELAREFGGYLAAHGWMRWSLFLLFLLLVARKPTLRYFRWRMEEKATKMEVSTYAILRGEIQELNQALKLEREETSALRKQIISLEKTVAELTAAIAKNNTTQ